jgi:hypothetical protein
MYKFCDRAIYFLFSKYKSVKTRQVYIEEVYNALNDLIIALIPKFMTVNC